MHNGKPIPKDHVYIYGKAWNKKTISHPYMIELMMFERETIVGPYERIIPGFDPIRMPGKYGHYKNFVNYFWDENNKRKNFLWHPWAETISREMCRNRFLTIGGCSGSSKSHSCAPWAIHQWLKDPMNTIVIVVSTTVTGAKRRIWGYIEEFWNSIPIPVPGKLQASFNQIVPFDGKKVVGQRTGIFLVAGEKGSEKESSDKILGFHANNVILILDELPDLSQAIVNTAVSNLRQNPNFQIIGLGNPCDYFDPFSILAEPEQGWQNVDVNMDRWKTKNGGLFLHFDSLTSPNILKGRTIYPFLPKIEEYEEARKNLGENSLLFWRQWRGFWPPEGAEDAIYSQAEIIKYGANLSDVEWAVDESKAKLLPMPQTATQNIPYAPVTLAFLDLGLVNGGDRCCLYFAKFGRDKEKKPKLLFYKYVILHEDVSDRINCREVQIVQAFRRECEKEGVHPSCAAFDYTGGGVPYRGFIEAIWSKDVVPICFGGAPTDLPVSDTDKTPSKEKYVNQVTEIWFSGKWLMREGIIKGLGEDVIGEMTKRKYSTNQGVDLKLKAESKIDMRKRIGKSPDCFVAGTMVMTPIGEVPIEELKVGDLVTTPWGESPIIDTQVSLSNEITTLKLPSGRELIGKSAHKILTNKGWIPMKDIEVEHKLDMYVDIWKWIFLDLLFTRNESTGFKSLVDTIALQHTGMVCRRNFYTGLSGIARLDQFLKESVSTIKTMIGRITELKIWNSLIEVPTQAITEGTALRTPSIEKMYSKFSSEPEKDARSGSQPRRGNPFKSKTEKTLGSSGSLLHETVLCAEFLFYPKHLKPRSVLAVATIQPEGVIPKIGSLGIALCAAIRSTLSRPRRRNAVQINVERGGVAQKTYNFTLLEHNVYYANGVLVQNCADAAFGLISLVRRKFRFNATNASMGAVSKNTTWKSFVKKHDARPTSFDSGYSGMKRSLDYSSK